MKRILYLGLDPSRYAYQGELIHFPLIQTKMRPLNEVKEAFLNYAAYTHIIFTSRTAVYYSFCIANSLNIPPDSLQKPSYLVLGKATAEALSEQGCTPSQIAKEEQGEGVCALLEELSTHGTYLFFPHSSLARTVIVDTLQRCNLTHIALPLYDTLVNQKHLPDLEGFDEIVFTSPSTVEAFKQLCTSLPLYKKCIPIGPITRAALEKIYSSI